MIRKEGINSERKEFRSIEIVSCEYYVFGFLPFPFWSPSALPYLYFLPSFLPQEVI